MLKQVFLARFEPVVMRVWPMENGNHGKIWGDQTVHAVSAMFRKTRRYTKVVCCVLNLCTRFFHRKVQGDQILHAMSARFRETRRYIKVVCCVLNLCTRFFHRKVQGDQIIHAMSAIFRKMGRYTKVGCCVLNLCTRFFHRKVHPCCERQIPQDEALYKSGLLRAELVH